MRKPGLAEFPDAKTERGAKHLDELGDMVEAGHRAVMLYLIQIGSASRFALARDIDPKYGAAYDRARVRGVEAIAWRCSLSRDLIALDCPGSGAGLTALLRARCRHRKGVLLMAPMRVPAPENLA